MVLLLDNYDSFTYNLYDYIAQLGLECKVVRNDHSNLALIKNLKFKSLVISPGPCTPATAGITNDLIAFYEQQLPILGICLGHQAIGQFYGATLSKAPLPMHGKTSEIITKPHPLFKSLPQTFDVMRYHSLILEHIPEDLRTIATTKEGINMAIAHKTLPIAGIQFHPESILTKNGLNILKNWFDWIS